MLYRSLGWGRKGRGFGGGWLLRDCLLERKIFLDSRLNQHHILFEGAKMPTLNCQCKACDARFTEVLCSNCKRANLSVSVSKDEKRSNVWLKCTNCQHEHHSQGRYGDYKSPMHVFCPKCRASVYVEAHQIPFREELLRADEKANKKNVKFILGAVIVIILLIIISNAN